MKRTLDTLNQQVSDAPSKSLQDAFNWPDNPAVPKLLDGVATVIAEEYIQTARKDSVAFRESPVGLRSPRHDEVPTKAEMTMRFRP